MKPNIFQYSGAKFHFSCIHCWKLAIKDYIRRLSEVIYEWGKFDHEPNCTCQMCEGIKEIQDYRVKYRELVQQGKAH